MIRGLFLNNLIRVGIKLCYCVFLKQIRAIFLPKSYFKFCEFYNYSKIIELQDCYYFFYFAFRINNNIVNTKK